jgi:tRNA uridine 5-carbamoylmethylation protein Kti12
MLTIYFNEEFSYAIVGWEESYTDGFGRDEAFLVTRAIKNKVVITDHCNHHNNSNASLRDSLGLK